MATVRRDLPRRMARLPAVRAKVRRVARIVLAAAQTRASAHRDSGTLAASLKIENSAIDARVVATDPRTVSKEYGHIDARTGRPIPGIHALAGAAQAADDDPRIRRPGARARVAARPSPNSTSSRSALSGRPRSLAACRWPPCSMPAGSAVCRRDAAAQWSTGPS